MSADSQIPKTAVQLGASVVSALLSAAKGNSHTATTAAAVLWPDKERQWLAALPALKTLMPGLCELGEYDPGQRRGPAVWLKCVIAGSLPSDGSATHSVSKSVPLFLASSWPVAPPMGTP